MMIFDDLYWGGEMLGWKSWETLIASILGEKKIWILGNIEQEDPMCFQSTKRVRLELISLYAYYAIRKVYTL